MKLLGVILATVSLCAGSAIPLVPGDNSHYVEGVSRYIWMPDGHGIPHLVDLEAPVDESDLISRNGANNEYWLFTRINPIHKQVIVHGDVNTIWDSNYDGNKPLMVIVHGWNNNGNSDFNSQITAEYLETTDANVIVVDWSGPANSLYTVAFYAVPGVGQFLGNFVTWLIENGGGSWNNVHFVGFSLGAHVVGNAGRTTGSLPGRITGLDPAGPRFGGSSAALNSGDGQYVETINTDGGFLGIFDPIAHCNFYPNGGRNPQPGCWISTCSHGRAHQLFAATVRFNHLTGSQCTSLEEAQNNKCTGASLAMGNSINSKQGIPGLYALSTASDWPY